MSAGNKLAAYRYDAFGRRVQNTINGVMTQYLYDGLNPVEELDGSSPPNVIATMLTGLGIDQYFARTDSNGTVSYLRNRMGSTLALTNSSGAITTQYTYDPFGNTTVSGSSTNPFQFTGRENDGTGLYYYRARYYSPMMQRFISQDPIGFAGGTADLYGYTTDDPVNYRDSTGMDWVAAGLAFGACQAVAVERVRDLFAHTSQYTKELEIIRRRLQKLRNCPFTMKRQTLIQKLELKEFKLTVRYWGSYAGDWVESGALEVGCFGAGAAGFLF